jgi:hypothetical protein
VEDTSGSVEGNGSEAAMGDGPAMLKSGTAKPSSLTGDAERERVGDGSREVLLRGDGDPAGDWSGETEATSSSLSSTGSALR